MCKVLSMTKRNDRCPCGSGKKYKKCHYLIHWKEEKNAKEAKAAKPIVVSSVEELNFIRRLINLGRM